MKRDQKNIGGGGCHAAGLTAVSIGTTGLTAVSIGTTVRLRGLDGRHGRLADAWGEPRAVSLERPPRRRHRLPSSRVVWSAQAASIAFEPALKPAFN